MALLALSVLLYGLNEGIWLLFLLLFLVPDVSMLEYLSESRVGDASYNLFHTYATPGLLAALGLLTESHAAVSLALVCFAHIGFDRMVGFGLKYPTGFSSSSTTLSSLSREQSNKNRRSTWSAWATSPTATNSPVTT